MRQKLLRTPGLRIMIVTQDMLFVTIMNLYYHTLELNYLKKIPLYSLPAAWNAAGNIKYQHNKTTFKIELKYNLLEEIYQESGNVNDNNEHNV